jgi:hypothetical protein
MGEVGESSSCTASKRSSDSSRQYCLATATAPAGGEPLVTCGDGTGVGEPTVAAGDEAAAALEEDALAFWAPPASPPQAASRAALAQTASASTAADSALPGRAVEDGRCGCMSGLLWSGGALAKFITGRRGCTG